ncbi:hypothetical protein [Nostoc sp. PA-18-2419]|uniref:hypothetical protein n=1 Tax=Nostoc sp. PA-18-2419 TaxID=2575443 RepID=UPI001676C701|nr:hypothetical protein [Nostoc sp. PA-18-2419]
MSNTLGLRTKVGWVDHSETQPSPKDVGLCASTQPTSTTCGMDILSVPGYGRARRPPDKKS